MFAFLASGDWRELVDEVGLPLRDRVAVALRYVLRAGNMGPITDSRWQIPVGQRGKPFDA